MAAALDARGLPMRVELAPEAAAEPARSQAEIIPAGGRDEDAILRLLGMRARAQVEAGANILLLGGSPDLDGHPAAALLGAAHGTTTTCRLWAPALPQAGYTTAEGVQMHRGSPMRLPAASLIRQLYSAAGGTEIVPERTLLAVIRGPGLERRFERAWSGACRLPICDAEAIGDLARIVDAALIARCHDRPLILAGARPLATLLADRLGPRPSVPPLLFPRLKPSNAGPSAAPSPLTLLQGRQKINAFLATTATTSLQPLGYARGGFVGARALDGRLAGTEIWLHA